MAEVFTFHSISLSGNFDVSIHLGPDQKNSITYPNGTGSTVPEVRLVDGWLTMNTHDDPNQPIQVAVAAEALSSIGGAYGAKIRVFGSCTQVEFVALRQSNIDASDLELVNADVCLEMSTVTMAATGSVNGSVAYGARLGLLVEPTHSDISTANAGVVHWPSPQPGP